MSDRKTAQKPVVDSHSLVQTPIRSKFSIFARWAGLSTALALGSATTAFMLPRPAMAREGDTTVNGAPATKITLPATIAKLVEQSKKYSQGEIISQGEFTPAGTYGNMLLIPHEFKATIVLSADADAFGIEFTKGKGKKGTGFSDFKKAVEQATGKKWERAVMFFVFGKDSDTTEDYITAYALAADKGGNLIKYNGNYVGIGACYYTHQGVAYTTPLVVSEPTNVSKR